MAPVAPVALEAVGAQWVGLVGLPPRTVLPAAQAAVDLVVEVLAVDSEATLEAAAVSEVELGAALVGLAAVGVVAVLRSLSSSRPTSITEMGRIPGGECLRAAADFDCPLYLIQFMFNLLV